MSYKVVPGEYSLIDPYDIRSLKILHETAWRSGAGEIDTDVIIRCAEKSLRDARYDEALTILHGALVIEPDHPRAWALCGHAFENLGRDDDAQAAYEYALDHDEEDWPTTLALAALYARNQQSDRAHDLLVWLLGEVEEGPGIHAQAIELKHVLDEQRGRS